MQTTLASRIGKGLLTVNAAAIVRAVLHGVHDLPPRLTGAYHAISPFGSTSFASFAEARAFLEQIPETQLWEVAETFGSLVLDKDHKTVEGALPWVDLVPVLSVVRDRAPQTMLEIGTYFGYTTRALAQNLPGGTVHTLDLPENFTPEQDETAIPKDDFHLIKDRRVGAAFRSDPKIKNVVQHFGDSATWNYAPVKDATVFLIDGSHTYEYIKNDTEKCLALCQNRRATILWHDCDICHLGVVEYLSDLVKQGYPVRRITYTHVAILEVDGSQLPTCV